MARTRTKRTCRFGEVMTKLMEKYGETTYSLAEKLGVEQATIAQYTTCRRFPRTEVLERIAKTIGLSHKEKRELFTAYLELTFSKQAIQALGEVNPDVTKDEVSRKLHDIVEKLGKSYKVAKRAKVNEAFVRKVANLKFENMRVIEHKGSFASVLKALNLPPSLEAQVLYLFLRSRKAEDIISTLTKENS